MEVSAIRLLFVNHLLESLKSCQMQLLDTQEIPLIRIKEKQRIVYTSAIALKLSQGLNEPVDKIATQLAGKFQENYEVFVSTCELHTRDFTVKVLPSGFIQLELSESGLAKWLNQRVVTQLPGGVDEYLGGIADDLFAVQYSHARCCSLLRLAHRDRLITLTQPYPDQTPLLWSLFAPSSLCWLDADGKLIFSEAAEWRLMTQLVDTVDYIASPPRQLKWAKLALDLSEAFQEFYSQCRIWGEVKLKSPELAQARLGLLIITQSLLRFLLQEKLKAFAPLEL